MKEVDWRREQLMNGESKVTGIRFDRWTSDRITEVSQRYGIPFTRVVKTIVKEYFLDKEENETN